MSRSLHRLAMLRGANLWLLSGRRRTFGCQCRNADIQSQNSAELTHPGHAPRSTVGIKPQTVSGASALRNSLIDQRQRSGG